jgi:hypothetical protein
MRVFGGTDGHAILALWREVLFCLVLVASAAHAEQSFGPELGSEVPHLHIAQAMAANPDMHPEDACQGAGHCAPAFVIVPLGLTIAKVSQWQIAFVWQNATTALGRTVDPGQHPPKPLRAI